MIDIEKLIFARISSKLREDFPGILITGEPIHAPAQFPCVSIVEMDNNTYINSLDHANHEHHANVMYEINVYSDKVSGKKTETRLISSYIDGIMQENYFTRTLMEPMPNLMDSGVYRVLMRYTAVVSQEGRLYRR